MASALFLIIFLLLAWIYALYIIFLLILLRTKRKIHNKQCSFYPTIEILIPSFNEENLIESRIKNLLNLDYPLQKLNFTFVDGGSTDDTIKLIKSASAKNKRIRLIQTNLRNKIKQLNKALHSTQADIICVSDVDTVLEKKAMKCLALTFTTDPQVWVVGAHTLPKKTISLDRFHWQTQNEARLLESKAFSSSSVIANCYAFRNKLLREFPEDVIADDVYIVFLAQSKGLQVVYTDEPLAFEVRSPKTIQTFIQHKFRKAHANITETLRFFPQAHQGKWQWKVIYHTKLLQVVGAPFIIFSFFILALYFIKDPILPVSAMLLLLVLIVTSSLLLQTQYHGQQKQLTSKSQEDRLAHYFLTLTSLILVNLILFFAVLMYPFYKQTASYRKIQ